MDKINYHVKWEKLSQIVQRLLVFLIRNATVAIPLQRCVVSRHSHSSTTSTLFSWMINIYYTSKKYAGYTINTCIKAVLLIGAHIKHDSSCISNTRYQRGKAWAVQLSRQTQWVSRCPNSDKVKHLLFRKRPTYLPILGTPLIVMYTKQV